MRTYPVGCRSPGRISCAKLCPVARVQNLWHGEPRVDECLCACLIMPYNTCISFLWNTQLACFAYNRLFERATQLHTVIVSMFLSLSTSKFAKLSACPLVKELKFASSLPNASLIIWCVRELRGGAMLQYVQQEAVQGGSTILTESFESPLTHKL